MRSPGGAAGITSGSDNPRHDCYQAIIIAAGVLLWSAGAYAAGAVAERCSAEASAIMELTAALESESRPPATRATLLLRRGHLSRARGHHREALADYDAALDLAPDLAEAFVDRGRLYAEQADYPAALHNFDRAIEGQAGAS